MNQLIWYPKWLNEKAMTYIFQASSSLEQIELILPYGLQRDGILAIAMGF